MRVSKIFRAVWAVLVLATVGLWISPFTLGSAAIHTDAHGSSEFRRGSGGTGGRRPIRFSVEGDPELAARVTKALATRGGFFAGGAAALRTGEALAKIDVASRSRLVTPVYAHSQVHLRAVLASDAKLVEYDHSMERLTPALWSYPVVRGEYDVDLAGRAKGLVSRSGYDDAIAARLADEVERQLRTALVGDDVPVVSLKPSTPGQTAGH